MTTDHPVRPWYVCNGDPCTCKKPRSIAPDPSPAEQAVIDRFGIFDEEESVVAAFADWDARDARQAAEDAALDRP